MSAVPAEALRESVAIIGRTGSGKSYAAKGLVEDLLRANQRVCILDPTGVWYGLRSSVDGSKDGFPVTIFGGDHADVPIGENSGTELARIIGEANIPAIIDISELGRAASIRFATTFFETLYRVNRAPLTLILDEADIFAPQRVAPETTTLLNRIEQIARRGRVKGFRCWLITQRPADLHKSVLSQANTLIAMQLTAPHDLKAFGSWVEGQADPAQAKEILRSLPSMPKGSGWVWSPSHNVLDRVTFPSNTTYDSGRTPADDEALPVIEFCDIDMSALNAALIEGLITEYHGKAKPAVMMHDVIANSKGNGAAAMTAQELAAIQAKARTEGYWEGLAEGVHRERERIAGLLRHRFALIIDDLPIADEEYREVEDPPVSAVEPDKPAAPILRQCSAPMHSATLNNVERAILTVLVQRMPKPATRAQIALLSGYSAQSSSTPKALANLRELGLIQGSRDTTGTRDRRWNTTMRTWAATEDGKTIAGNVPKLPIGTALRDYWRSKLAIVERAFFDVIVAGYPARVSKERIAEQAGYSPTSSSFPKALARLRTLGLIEGRADFRANAELFI